MRMAVPALALQARPDRASRPGAAGEIVQAGCRTPAGSRPVGVLDRPGRIVAGWLAAVLVVVAGSSAYLSLLVHMAMMGRQVARLQAELAAERRRAEALEVALARETSPARTEQVARLVLAMERPSHVRLVVLDGPQAPALARSTDAGGAGPGALARAGGGAGRPDGPVGWLTSVRSSLAGLLQKPVALAQQLPSWP